MLSLSDNNQQRKTKIRNQYNQVLHLAYLFIVDLSNLCTSYVILCLLCHIMYRWSKLKIILQGRYKANMV